MSTAQLTSEILQQVSLITDDEGKLQRVLRYLKRITTPKPDPTEMTYDEFCSMVHESETQYSRGEYTTQLPGESVSDMLKRCGYGV
jgi:hypothetical protein